MTAYEARCGAIETADDNARHASLYWQHGCYVVTGSGYVLDAWSGGYVGGSRRLADARKIMRRYIETGARS